MSTIKTRVEKLEVIHPDPIKVLVQKVNRVLADPSLVSPEAYTRIVELLQLAKQRRNDTRKDSPK